MDIYLICARFGDEDHDEVLDVWDEYTVDGNEDGFDEKVQSLRDEYPKADIRTAIVEVPDDFFSQVFKPVRVKGKLKDTE